MSAIQLVRGGKDRHRMVEPAPIATPFYSWGETWRGEHYLPKRGWYVVDTAKVLHGPFVTRIDANARAR